MSKTDDKARTVPVEDDDEPDEWYASFSRSDIPRGGLW